MAIRLNDYFDKNKLTEKMPSAYRASHSTEMGLIKVQNDIFMALHKRQNGCTGSLGSQCSL